CVFYYRVGGGRTMLRSLLRGHVYRFRRPCSVLSFLCFVEMRARAGAFLNLFLDCVPKFASFFQFIIFSRYHGCFIFCFAFVFPYFEYCADFLSFHSIHLLEIKNRRIRSPSCGRMDNGIRLAEIVDHFLTDSISSSIFSFSSSRSRCFSSSTFLMLLRAGATSVSWYAG